ncbi:myosin light chain kinase, smooth muscle-like [Mustelus asterias]
MKDDDDIKEDDNLAICFENNTAILKIIAGETKHGGKYICQAKNDAGIEKCFATLTVTEPAKIVERAKSHSVTVRNPANLECTVAGTPNLKNKWFKDGKQITPSRNYKMSFEKNIASLKILSVEKSSSGEYTFEVQNEFGVDSCKASLTVLG